MTHFQVDAGELYDVVNYQTKEQPGVSVQALRTLWDQKTDHPRDPDNNQQQTDPPTLPPPALPPKSSKSRKLTGVVSADSATLSQVRRTSERVCELLNDLSVIRSSAVQTVKQE